MAQRVFSLASLPRLVAGWWLIVVSLLPQLALAEPATPPPKLGLPREMVCSTAIRDDFSSRTQTLLANCRTDRPLFVPGGWTFDGDGHTISVVDPPGGRFVGGAIMVSDEVGSVRDVTIDGANLNAPCLVDHAQTYLTGVLFADATGAVTDITVRNLRRVLPDTTTEQEQGARMSCGSGITVFGATTPVLITRNRISNVGNAAVWIEGGNAAIAHNTINRAADAGVLALLGADVRVGPGNQMTNASIGIQFESAGTTGTASGNTIEDTTLAGIAVVLGAHATIADTSLRAPGTAGIAVEGEGSEATVASTVIEAPAEFGIRVLGGDVSLRQNTVVDAKSGIAIGGGASAEVTQNVLTTTTSASEAEGASSPRGVGLLVYGATTTATATANRLERQAFGIVVLDGATASDVSGNTVLESRFGIGVTDEGSSAMITDNTIGLSAEIGLSVEGGATAEMRGNRITRANWGIRVTDAGSAATLTGNRIERTADAGIALWPGSQATIADNVLVDPGPDGIRVSGEGVSAAITGNLVTGAETGILIDGSAEATVGAGNHIAGGARGVAIQGQGTTATVIGSTFARLSEQAIVVRDGAAGTIRDNDISGGDPAILIADHRAVTVEHNTIHDAAATAIVIEQGSLTTASAAVTNPDAPVSIVTKDIFFAPREVTIPADRDIVFFLRNDGAMPHSFVIAELDVAIDLQPNELKRIVINAPAGIYQFSCHVPGHYEAGMVGTLTVGGDQEHPSPEPPISDAIRSNAIEGGSNGIVAKGDGVAVAIAANRISRVAQTALSIESGAQVELSDNIVTAAKLGLNIAAPGTRVTAEGNKIYDSGEDSITIQNGAAADLRHNVVTRPGDSGIVVFGSATSVSLTGTIVTDAVETGISIERGAEAAIGAGNLVSGGMWGIAIMGEGTTAEVRGSRVNGAVHQEISVLRGARATIEGNTVSGGDAGISIKDTGTTSVITGNTISGADKGMDVWDGAIARSITANSVNDCVNGILVTGSGSRATIDGNRIHGPNGHGGQAIGVGAGAIADIVRNVIRDEHGGPDGWAIRATGLGTSVAVNENDIADIEGTGIEFSAGAQGAAHRNIVKNTSGNGLHVVGMGTIADLIENTVNEPRAIGIEIAAGTATVDKNVITGAPWIGIAINPGAKVQVSSNDIAYRDQAGSSEVGTTGINVSRSVDADVRGNSVAGYGCGIRIAASAPDVTVRDNHFPDPGNEVDICDERTEGTPTAAPRAATPVVIG
ncbi:MAG: right-handed parallel beta-helix repeat-containing protein [Thermomicrobiales bacterium]